MSGASSGGGRDGSGALEGFSSTCGDVTEESMANMATSGTAADNARRGGGGGEEERGGAGGKMGGRLRRIDAGFHHQGPGSADIASGSTFLCASPINISGGAPSAKVRLLDIAWIIERVGHYLLGYVLHFPQTRDCRLRCSMCGLQACWFEFSWSCCRSATITRTYQT